MWWGHIILPVHQRRLLMELRRRGRVVVVVDIREGRRRKGRGGMRPYTGTMWG